MQASMPNAQGRPTEGLPSRLNIFHRLRTQRGEGPEIGTPKIRRDNAFIKAALEHPE
jgi:hypothetical protein